MPPDPLLLPANPHRVRAAAQPAALPPPALDRALEIATATPDHSAWHRFLSRTLALLGTALILAGVVCFFAYNWDRLGRFGKLGLIETGIVAAALVAWWRLPRVSGQIALTAAAVLVGPLLAVYGQTYQTGADPYGLFLTWALLELALVALAGLVLAAGTFVLDPTEYGGPIDAAGLVALALLVAGIPTAFWYYQHVRSDRFMVTAAGAAGLALGAFVVGRVVVEDLDLEGWGLLLLAIFVVAEITYGLRWLRQTRPPGHESEA